MTCEGTKHRFNLSRLADGDAPWLCECGAVEWMEENGNLDCVALDLEKVLRVAQETHKGPDMWYMSQVNDPTSFDIPEMSQDEKDERLYGRLMELGKQIDERVAQRRGEIQPDHLIEPPDALSR